MSEIGVFIRATANSAKEDLKERLWANWVSGNTSKKEIEDYIKSLGNTKKQDQKKIGNDWNKLKSFIGGR